MSITFIIILSSKRRPLLDIGHPKCYHSNKFCVSRIQWIPMTTYVGTYRTPYMVNATEDSKPIVSMFCKPCALPTNGNKFANIPGSVGHLSASTAETVQTKYRDPGTRGN